MEVGAQQRHTKCSCSGSQSWPLHLCDVNWRNSCVAGIQSCHRSNVSTIDRSRRDEHFYFVGFRMLCKPVAKSEVAIETHKFSKINIGNTRVASNDKDRKSTRLNSSH